MFNMGSFVNEFEKLSAHTVQKCRSGSMPIRVAKLLDKDVYDRSATKTAAADMPGIAKPLVTGALAVGAWEALRRANKDRQQGRMMRIQQNMY